jgi:hypothetical protein
MEHEHINNPYDIFKVIEYDEDNLNEDLNEYENCIVKVVVKNKNDQKKYEKYLDKLVKCNPYELKLIESCIINTNIELPESNAESEDTLSLLKRYVDESEVSLNKNEIKRLINSIYQESYQI